MCRNSSLWVALPLLALPFFAACGVEDAEESGVRGAQAGSGDYVKVIDGPAYVFATEKYMYKYKLQNGDVFQVKGDFAADPSNWVEVRYMAWTDCGIPAIDTGRIRKADWDRKFSTLAGGTIFTAKPAGNPLVFSWPGDDSLKPYYDLKVIGSFEEGLEGWPPKYFFSSKTVRVTTGYQVHTLGAVGLIFLRPELSAVAGKANTFTAARHMDPDHPEKYFLLKEGTELELLERRPMKINSSTTCWYRVRHLEKNIEGWVSQWAYSYRVGIDEFTWDEAAPAFAQNRHVYFIAPPPPPEDTPPQVCAPGDEPFMDPVVHECKAYNDRTHKYDKCETSKCCGNDNDSPCRCDEAPTGMVCAGYICSAFPTRCPTIGAPPALAQPPCGNALSCAFQANAFTFPGATTCQGSGTSLTCCPPGYFWTNNQASPCSKTSCKATDTCVSLLSGATITDTAPSYCYFNSILKVCCPSSEPVQAWDSGTGAVVARCP